jgi:hypothetical protein
MSLPPKAADLYTHLAHAMICYLGLTAPKELVPFGINDMVGIIDLISQVCPTFGVLPFSKPIYKNSILLA